ncbi:MAG: DNA translocase FtsK [Ruminococcaceae bacterium]|nr:DNA translocase FtsK [Oscillospiraceae bacterium]
MPDIVLPEAHPVAEEESVPDAGTVDERIFDEVMRRTRERVEKNARNAGTPLTESAASAAENGVPADTAEEMENCVELDRAEFVPEMDDRAPWEEADEPIFGEELLPEEGYDGENAPVLSDIPAAGASNVLITPTGVKTISTEAKAGEGNVDLTGIFVNPEDAQLLDRLSAAYMQKDNTLGVARQNIGSAQNQPQAVKLPKEPVPEYNFPPISILTEDTEGQPQNIKEELQENAVKLVETLRSFNVKTKIENISRGPTITRYELCPEPGTKVRSIVNLVDDIALNLATTGVRIEAPIPGKAAVGVEVPNKKQSTVHLRTLIEDEKFSGAKSRLTCCLGADVAGDSIYFDIAKMPHLLIAGATGMGKSVCINSLIVSLLYKAKPDEVKLILVDPKKVELSIYNGIPHLLVPVVSDPKKAAGSLSWAVGEMERRFGLIEAVGVRDVKMFNEVTKNDPDYEYLPQIVIIIDELADLMMTAPDDVEESICRLAQKARAAGMHLIIGTQRPSVDVITGLIKANIPSRIAFTVASQIDSRTIIDRSGAENLIGRGDMLFNPVGAAKPMRVQGAYVSEADVEEIVSYIKNMNQKCESYSDEVLEQIEKEAQRCGSGKKGGGVSADLEEGMDGEEDPMLRQALELAVESGKISTSLIQRRLSLGYGRAAKLIDRMEQMGYVSPPEGQKPRNVLITKQEFMEMVLKNEMQ